MSGSDCCAWAEAYAMPLWFAFASPIIICNWGSKNLEFGGYHSAIASEQDSYGHDIMAINPVFSHHLYRK
jgi:hypothetical protein